MRLKIYCLIGFLLLAMGMSVQPASYATAGINGGYPASEFLEQIDHVGGEAQGTFFYQQYALVSRIGGTVLYNIDDPSNPVEISKIIGVTIRAISDSYVYGQTDTFSEWEVWDIHEPHSPIKVGKFQEAGKLLAATSTLLIFAEHAYSPESLSLYTLNTPAQPQRIGTWTTGEESLFIDWVAPIETRLLVSTFKIICNRDGCDRVYQSLQIVDITNPTTPETVGTGSASLASMERFAVNGRFFYQTKYSRLHISELSEDLTSISLLSTSEMIGFNPPVITSHGTLLYLANMDLTKIYDVSDPLAPIEVATVPDIIGGRIYQGYLYGLTAYPTEKPFIHIFDLTNPQLPVLVTTLNNVTANIVWQGTEGRLYLLDITTQFGRDTYYLHKIDISVPSQPTLLSTHDLGEGQMIFGEAVVIEDEYLYKHNQYVTDIYRLPTENTPLTYLKTIAGMGAMTVRDNTLFIQNYNGVMIYSVADAENPILMSSISVPSDFGDGKMLIEENRIYIVKDKTISVVDISNLEEPSLITQFQDDIFSRGGGSWSIKNGYLYYFTVEGLTATNIRDPYHPYSVVIDTPNVPEFYNLMTHGNKLYLQSTIDCPSPIIIYDIADPSTPKTGYPTKMNCTPSTGSPNLIPNGAFLHAIEDSWGVRTYTFVEGIPYFLPLLQRN